MALTYDDILSKSSPLEFVSDVIYQDTADVDVIGFKLFSKEIGNRKAVLYKDAEFKRPLKDMELLSLFFMNTSSYEISDNVVTNIVGPLKRLSCMQYKDGNFTRNFFVGSGLNQFISGETYDAICEHLGNDDEPEPEPEDEYKVLVIPQQTFMQETPGSAVTIPLQNSTLVDGTTPLKVIFDGETYIANYNEESHHYGAPYNLNDNEYDFSEYPFFISVAPFGTFIAVADHNEHTVKAYVKVNDGV